MQKGLESFIDNIKKDECVNIYDESNTKSIIINKFLDILGWDLYNHDEVELEYNANHGKVDYALIQYVQRPILLAYYLNLV